MRTPLSRAVSLARAQISRRFHIDRFIILAPRPNWLVDDEKDPALGGATGSEVESQATPGPSGRTFHMDVGCYNSTHWQYQNRVNGIASDRPANRKENAQLGAGTKSNPWWCCDAQLYGIRFQLAQFTGLICRLRHVWCRLQRRFQAPGQGPGRTARRTVGGGSGDEAMLP